MRNDKSERMYEVNDLLDKLRTEFYELFDFDPEIVVSTEREERRREVMYLISELRRHAERS